MALKRTWQEKLHDSKDLPKVGPIPTKMQKSLGTGTFVIPAPMDVDAVMRKVPKGKLITINEIRAVLAERSGADTACPLTTGIFAWIAAHAAEEAASNGKKRITPYWRTLKTGGELNPRFPGGAEGLKKRLEAEGHTIAAKGRRWVVEDHERKLAAIKIE